MGHREELLAGAQECLHDKGWGRTSARDVVAASGTNLASIGYHFGSKDALLAAALVASTAECAEAVDRALTDDPPLDPPADDVSALPAGDPLDRFERTWERVVERVARDERMTTATVEALAQAPRVPQVRSALAAAADLTREDLALTFHAAGDDDERTRVLGAFYQSLLIGTLVQWAVDPAGAPSGHDLAEALRMIVADSTENT
ncbi:TetR/AcrR family transcriptional regulator [Pseudonocardia sp. N23]|uniref:TetR/AcrR family transcriptional regulator n=1 Tax=Pseudonocardia sp. N23 TaxID=1987376 RepID=UPI000BFC1039|nr:TetR/AcrR family transcriptional regulator [Pseudonocardia sp. N23]GAY09330.1 transcriptional regulator, tetr family [Pseudonocardia sp. N23]